MTQAVLARQRQRQRQRQRRRRRRRRRRPPYALPRRPDARVLGECEPWKGTPADLFVQAQFPIRSDRLLGLPIRIRTWAMRLVATSSSQLAELNWPTRPLRLVVGFGGGSSPDFVAHALAVPMAKALGQPVVVENHPGASGNIAADIVAKSTDRHTVGILINGNMTIAKVLNPATPYDPQRDLVPLSIICTAPLVLATTPEVSKADARGFLDAARAAGST